MELETQLIKLDGGTQARAGLNKDTVTEYRELISQSGGEWPFKDPIIVYYDGDQYWLADGFHRITAARQHGRFVCEADVRQGSQRDAILHAAGANADHGLRRTPEDKRRAVLRLLEDAEWGKWSDREISRRCKVSPTFVGNLRKEVTVHVDSDQPQERTYTTKHGTTATMKTANIGANSQEAHSDDLRHRLRQHLRLELYEPYAVKGINNTDLKAILGRNWGLGGGSSGPNMTAVYRKGGRDPRFWYKNHSGTGAPTLRGVALLDLVRELLDLPYPQKETAVSNPEQDEWTSASNSVVEIREAIMVWYIRQRLNDIPGQYELMRAIQNETVDHPLWREMVDHCPAGGKLVDLLQAIDHLVNMLEGRVNELREETAVSAPKPMHEQVLEEVVYYENEKPLGVFGSVTDALTSPITEEVLKNGGSVIFAERSLLDSLKSTEWLIEEMMIQTEAPSAMFFALNKVVMAVREAIQVAEAQEKSTAERKPAVDWLRSYQDKDGRLWSDLTPGQTHHANSPCYQAFVAAFPDEKEPKFLLKQARAHLERETAVSEEAS